MKPTRADFLESMRVVQRRRLASARAAAPERELEKRLAACPLARDFAAALRRRPGGPINIIAEVKRSSPSAGHIRAAADPAALAAAMAGGGAAALSVLTEPEYFGGSLEDLKTVAGKSPLPVMRKDFILDRYQLLEARLLGASACLLIVPFLGADLFGRLLAQASELGLAVLAEAHDEDDLAVALATGAAVIGVNNRDLRSLAVDMCTASRLAGMVPKGVISVAESGYISRAATAEVEALGYDAVLAGEAVMRAEDPAAAIRALRGLP